MTRTQSLSWIVSLVLLVAAPLASAQDDADRARAHTEFERGVAAYTAHDYQTALDAFQEAYRLAPHASVRLNIANCYDQLGRPIEALFHFEHYLTEATGLTGAQRREVQASIDRLEARVGTITLAITPDGAAITIDGGDVRRAPVSEPVRVVAGDHVVDITLDGYAPEHQTVHVDGGGNVRVAIRLRRAEVVATTTVPPVETPTTTETAVETTETVETAETVDTAVETTELVETPIEHDEGGGGIRITDPVWIMGSITLAAAIGWGIAGGIALSANSAFEDDVYNVMNAPTAAQAELARESGRSHADTARSAAIASDVLLATTLVGLGTTTFFFILAQVEGDGDDDASARLMVTPVVSPDFVGATAAGSF